MTHSHFARWETRADIHTGIQGEEAGPEKVGGEVEAGLKPDSRGGGLGGGAQAGRRKGFQAKQGTNGSGGCTGLRPARARPGPAHLFPKFFS